MIRNDFGDEMRKKHESTVINSLCIDFDCIGFFAINFGSECIYYYYSRFKTFSIDKHAGRESACYGWNVELQLRHKNANKHNNLHCTQWT